MKYFLILISFLSFNSAYSQSRPSDFVEAKDLEKNLKSFCLKSPVLNSSAQTTILETTSRQTKGIHFESIRFEMLLKGIEGNPDCVAEREVIQILDNKNSRRTLLDSGFYPDAYCETPVRFSHPPIVFEMESLSLVIITFEENKIFIEKNF